MNLKKMHARANDAEALLKAVANKHRLMVLCNLLGGERTVTALQEAVGLSQSALSQHLARLRDDDLVATRREAQTIHYSIASPKVEKLIALLYDMYCGVDVERPPRGGEMGASP